MEAPSGHADLLADAEAEWAAIEREEALVAKRKAELLARRPEGPQIVEMDENGNVLAVPEEAPWEHEMLEDFFGEDFEVRRPTAQALAAFSLCSGKYINQKMQNDMVGLFIKQHMSEKSHERVYVRMMDPDDPEFTPQTLGELMRRIATIGTGRPTEPSQLSRKQRRANGERSERDSLAKA